MTYWNGSGWEADRPAAPPPRRRHGRRLLGAATEAGLITLLMFGLIAGTTLAARGGSGKPAGSTSAALSLVLLDSTDGVAHHGQRVTFEVVSSADQPYVNLRCTQDGVLVYDAWAGFYDTAWFGQEFTLASQSWLAGAADCTARLVAWGKNGRERELTRIEFGVAA